MQKKITLTLAAAAFVLGSMAIANAQTQGASSLNAQAQNAASSTRQVACVGVVPTRATLVCAPQAVVDLLLVDCAVA